MPARRRILVSLGFSGVLSPTPTASSGAMFDRITYCLAGVVGRRSVMTPPRKKDRKTTSCSLGNGHAAGGPATTVAAQVEDDAQGLCELREPCARRRAHVVVLQVDLLEHLAYGLVLQQVGQDIAPLVAQAGRVHPVHLARLGDGQDVCPNCAQGSMTIMLARTAPGPVNDWHPNLPCRRKFLARKLTC